MTAVAPIAILIAYTGKDDLPDLFSISGGQCRDPEPTNEQPALQGL